MSSIDYLNLCRLCLVKESAFVPIFDGEGDSRQIFHKIAACLPVKVTRDDKLPKKICNECVQKIELFYQFCNTTTNAEKQLLEWIGGVDLNDKQTYVSAVINQDQSSNNRLDGNVMQQTNEQHQNNIDMNMMESIGLEMPMMIQQNQTQMTINYTNNTNAQSMQSNTIAQQQNNSKNMEESDDDHCGGDDDMGQNEELSVKEEIQDSNRTIEPTFVSVSSPCEEAGPSGLQQKSGDIPDGQFLAGQSTDGDPKSGLKKNMKTGNIGEIRRRKSNSITIIDVEEDILKEKKKIEEIIIIDSDLNQEDFPLAYFCSMCRELFENKQTLNTHMLIHNDEKLNNTCKECDRVFRNDKILNQHMINFHILKNTEYKCETCNETFDHIQKYRNHLSVHIPHDDLICEYCDDSFSSKRKLLEHLREIHPRSKKVINTTCNICGNILSSSRSLRRHLESHNPTKSYLCDFCGKSLSNSENLKKHRRIHTGEKPYICHTCGKGFTVSANLLLHIRTHTGEKPYKCDVCSKTFSQKTTLTIHQRRHTGERPYVCERCKRGFSCRGNLTAHQKTYCL